LPELFNNPYFVLLLAILVGALGYVIWRPEAIPAFLFLLLSALGVFFDVANVQRVSLLKAILLPALMAVLLLRKLQSGERMPLSGFVWVASYGAFVVLSCLINGTDINQYRASLGLLLIPLVVALCPNKEKTVKYLTFAFAFWGLVNLLVVVATWAGLGWARAYVTTDSVNISSRFSGLMGISTMMAIYFVISLNAVHVLFYQADTKFGRLLLLALGAGLALGLVGTVSVGALAGWGVSFLYIQYRLSGLRVGNLIGIGAVAVLILGGAAFLNLDTLLGRVSRLSSDQSAVGRLTLLEMGMKRFLTSPLLGVGLGQSGKVHLEVHNTFMQVLMETGIVGFTLFCGVLWRGVRGLRRRAGPDEAGTLTPEVAYYVGLLGTMLAILVDASVHSFDLLMPLWLLIGIAFMV
jgi:O-antigen ligase